MILDPNIEYSAISLSMLQQHHSFSSRSVTICRMNQLNSLDKIINFYAKNQSFSMLRGVGEKTNEELNLFCEHFYKNKSFYDNLVKKAVAKKALEDRHSAFISLSPLQKNIINNYIRLKINSLSLRVAHVITRNVSGEVCFDEFAQVFLKADADLAKFRHIGAKSLQEFALFIEDVEDFVLKQTHWTGTNTPSETVMEQVAIPAPLSLPSLSALKKQIVSDYILRATKKLSKPIRHWMTTALNPPFTFDIFVETFLTDPFLSVFQELAYSQELHTFTAKIRNQIQLYAAIADSQMPNYAFLNILSQTFGLNTDSEALFIAAIEKKAFFLFSFFEHLVDNEYLMNEKQMIIFKYRTQYFQYSNELTLNELGKYLQLTRERVRQLSISLEGNIEPWWQFLMDYSDDIQLFTNYKLKNNDAILLIETSFIQSINQLERTNLSRFFFNKTFSHLYHKTHALIGDTFDDFKNTYLIRKKLTDVFAFEPFLDTIYQQISDELYEDLKLDMDELLYNFIRKEAVDLLASIRDTCKKIIQNEFAETVEFDFDNHIIFKQNIKTYNPEIIITILQANGNPMSVKHIYETCNNKYGEMALSYKMVREIIDMHRDLFILFGRNAFGLAEWEETQENVKSGTIRDLVESYLNAFDEPKHISELTEYVLKYRPKSNLYSINTNLCSEPTQRFQEFKGGFWGLHHKKYENIDFKNIPAFFVKYVKIMIRTDENNEYETILTRLCERFGLKKIQVQSLIENNIKNGTLRRVNHYLEIC